MIEGYGIVLRPFDAQDLERVLMWRNSDHIRSFALHSELISMEEHQRWYERLLQSEDRYFVIEADGYGCGLIWYQHINEKIETGFYLYDQKKQTSLFPFKVVTLFHHFLFGTLQLSSIWCKIMPHNLKAIRFNEALGYKKAQEFPTYGLYELTKEDYETCGSKIEKLLHGSGR